MRIHSPQEKWSQAYTANVSIGQGYDLCTPLQMAMAYSTMANKGTSYYPRLVKKVLNQDGTPVRDEKGKVAWPEEPRMRANFRNEISETDIELERRGFWKVVNEDGGTGGKARLSNVQVAGKTGTAQATDHGRKDTIAWFICWAPFENPKYAIAVMVQGGEHGGSVAAPIATRILERSLAMEEGKYEAELAWIAPAHKQNPFQMIAAVDFKNAGPNLASGDEENLDSQNGDSQMAAAGADPDVEPEADAQGQVEKHSRTPRALPVATPPPRKVNFFERLFGPHRSNTPAPLPTPTRRSSTR
jgi:penicillin-binding protein 2